MSKYLLRPIKAEALDDLYEAALMATGLVMALRAIIADNPQCMEMLPGLEGCAEKIEAAIAKAEGK